MKLEVLKLGTQWDGNLSHTEIRTVWEGRQGTHDNIKYVCSRYVSCILYRYVSCIGIYVCMSI